MAITAGTVTSGNPSSGNGRNPVSVLSKQPQSLKDGL